MKKTSILFAAFVLIIINIYSQNYTIIQKELKDNSKKLNYDFTLTYPQIKPFNENIGSIMKFNDFMKDKAYAVRDTFRVWMRDWDTISNVKDFGSYYEAWDSVYYSKSEIISVLFSESYYFAGAAHPNNSSFSVNYNMKTGKEFSLNDILQPGWETAISDICIADLTEQKKGIGIEPNEWVQDGAGPKAENFKVFNITADHLLITFPTYQVGSYVEGPSEVEIKYSAINKLIRKEGLLKDLIK